MIYRIYATKDTFITNAQRNRIQQTGSNCGASETISVFKKAGLSGSQSVSATASLARALMKFNVEPFFALTSSLGASGATYRLSVSDADHAETLPYSYDMEVGRIARDWDEGRGVDVDYFSDRGVANWVYAKASTPWTSLGGDVTGSWTTFHFDTGYEDISLDVTDFVRSWSSGTFSNHGLMVRVSSSLESSTEYNDYYLKKFHGRTSNFVEKRPFIEAAWDDSVRDDRNNFVYGVSGTLYLYNRVQGVPTNLSAGTGNVLVRIVDASGALGTFTGSYAGRTGLYSVTFALPSASYSGSLLRDVWFSGSSVYMTGSFTPAGRTAFEDNSPDQYFVGMLNLKNDYTSAEKTRLRLFVRPDNYAPAVVSTASHDYRGMVVTKAYYSILNDRSDEVVVGFGTGSVETTRLSYDGQGNYFDFYMSSLPPGNVYRIVYLFDVNNQRLLVDQGFKFRVK